MLVGWAWNHHSTEHSLIVYEILQSWVQHQGPLVVWSARSYLAAFYLPRLTDGSSSQDGDKRHIYSCLLATRAMNIQGCFSSSLRRKPAGQATWPSGHVQECLQEESLQQEDVKSEKFKSCDIHASWCYIQLSLLQLSLDLMYRRNMQSPEVSYRCRIG